MADGRYRIAPLARHHNWASISCGETALVRQQARQDMGRHIAAVFVLADEQTDEVAGYDTLSSGAIEATGLPPEVTKRLPRYPLFPAVLLGRLAVDVRHQGQRFGKLLLTDALRRAFVRSEEIAAMAVVDAKGDRARSFYERYGFRRFVSDEYRLFMELDTIRQLLQAD